MDQLLAKRTGLFPQNRSRYFFQQKNKDEKTKKIAEKFVFLKRNRTFALAIRK